MDSPLTGTIAIVTGASSGIGAATARSLARQGATVVVIARRKGRLDSQVLDIETSGGKALAIEADITDRAQAERSIATVVSRFGRIDILVNNAGLMLIDPILDADIDEWKWMIAINQKALLYMTHAALPHLLAAAQDGPPPRTSASTT